MKQTLLTIQNNIIKYANMYQKQVIQEKKSDVNMAVKNVLQTLINQDKQSLFENILIKQDKDLQYIAGQILDKLKKGNITLQSTFQVDKVEKVEQASTEKKIDPKQQNKIESKSSIVSWKSLIIDKFIKKQPEGAKMILPEKEQKTTWDPIRKIYLFQGEEPEQPKQIPKPPPIKNNISKNQTKSKQKSQIDQMLAPASFKRKVNKSKQLITPAVLTYQEFVAKIETQFSLFNGLKVIKDNSNFSNQVQMIANQILYQYDSLLNQVSAFQAKTYLQICKQFQNGDIDQNNNLNSLCFEIINNSNFNIELFSKIKMNQARFNRNKSINTNQIDLERKKNLLREQQKNIENECLRQENNKLLSLIKIHQDFIQKMKSHQDLSEQFNSAVQAQFQISAKVQQRRLALQMNTPNPLQLLEISFVNDSQRLLELSEATSLMVKGHMAKIKNSQTQCLAWQQKYTTVKQALHKKKSQINIQQALLNRTMLKLKNLNEAYRIQQEKAEERANLAQIENQKMKKQFLHMKQEDSFNKQLLQQSIINFQNLKSEFETIEIANRQLFYQKSRIQEKFKETQITIRDQQNDFNTLLQQNSQLQKKLKQVQRKSSKLIQQYVKEIDQLNIKIRQLENTNISILEERKQNQNNYSSQINKLIKEMQDYKSRTNSQLEQIQTEKQIMRQSFENQKKQIQNKALRSISIAEQKMGLSQQKLKQFQVQYDILKANQASTMNCFQNEARQYKETINEMSKSMQNLRIQQLELISEWKDQQCKTQQRMNSLVQQLNLGKLKSEQLTRNISEYRQYVNKVTQEYQNGQSMKERQGQIEQMLLELDKIQNAKNILEQNLKQKELALIEAKDQIKCLLQSQKKLKDQITSYQNNIHQLESDSQQKNTNITFLTKNYQLLEANIQKLNQKNISLQHEATQLVQQLQKKDLSLNLLLINNNQTANINQQLNLDIIQLKNDIIKYQNQLSRQQNQYKLLKQTKIQQKQANQKSNKDQDKQYQEQIQILMGTVEALQSSSLQKDKQIEQCKQTILFLKKQNQNLSEKLIFCESEKSKLSNSNEEQIKQIIKTAQSKHLQQVNDLRNIISQLNSNLSKNQNELQIQSAKKIQSLQKKIIQLQTEGVLKTTKYSQAIKTILEMENREKVSDEKLKELERQNLSIINIKKQNKKLYDNLKQLQVQNNELLKQKTELLAANQKLMEERSPKTGQISQNKSQILQYNKKPLPAPEGRSSGILGSLSSLFLTPTELQKMSNPKPK